ncbi:hypothetical protein SNEBB_007584 [Seison nebaliae]|nr:hypothetical protein SNEBB_007584 [Seison nebaliae]
MFTEIDMNNETALRHSKLTSHRIDFSKPFGKSQKKPIYHRSSNIAPWKQTPSEGVRYALALPDKKILVKNRSTKNYDDAMDQFLTEEPFEKMSLLKPKNSKMGPIRRTESMKNGKMNFLNTSYKKTRKHMSSMDYQNTLLLGYQDENDKEFKDQYRPKGNYSNRDRYQNYINYNIPVSRPIKRSTSLNEKGVAVSQLSKSYSQLSSLEPLPAIGQPPKSQQSFRRRTDDNRNIDVNQIAATLSRTTPTQDRMSIENKKLDKFLLELQQINKRSNNRQLNDGMGIFTQLQQSSYNLMELLIQYKTVFQHWYSLNYQSFVKQLQALLYQLPEEIRNNQILTVEQFNYVMDIGMSMVDGIAPKKQTLIHQRDHDILLQNYDYTCNDPIVIDEQMNRSMSHQTSDISKVNVIEFYRYHKILLELGEMIRNKLMLCFKSFQMIFLQSPDGSSMKIREENLLPEINMMQQMLERNTDIQEKFFNLNEQTYYQYVFNDISQTYHLLTRDRLNHSATIYDRIILYLDFTYSIYLRYSYLLNLLHLTTNSS